MRSPRILALALAMALAPVAVSRAQDAPAAATEEPATPRDRLKGVREVAETRLAAVRVLLGGLPAAPSPGTTGVADPARELREVLGQEEDDLQATVLVVEQEGAALDQLDRLATEIEQARQSLEQLRRAGPVEKPPFSFLLVDKLRDAHETLERGGEAAEAELDLARSAVESAEERNEEVAAERRRLEDALARITEAGPDRQIAQARVDAARARAVLVEERLGLRRLERDLAVRQGEIRAVRLTRAREKYEWVRSRAVFREEDLAARTKQFAEEKEALSAELAQVQARLREVQAAWAKVRSQLQSTSEPSTSLRDHEQFRRLEVRLQQLRVSTLNRWIEWVDDREQSWTRRFQLAKEGAAVPRATLDEWTAKASALLADLAREHRLASLRLSELRKEFLHLEQALEEGEPGAVTWSSKQRLELRQRLMKLGDEHLERIEEVRRDVEKLAEDLAARAPNLLSRDWVGDAGKIVAGVWNFELLVADDRPVTVGKVVIAFALFLLGLLVSRRGSAAARKLVRDRFHVDPGAAASIESIVFYVLLVGGSLFALNVAGVPLTVFAFVGGAVAIGIGFGSQNLINNFISGVLLLLERPIRVGDLVEVGGTRGRVTRIGARCTAVQTAAGADILIPNSSFLESNVINLTFGTRRIRVDLLIGVAYGTDAERVRELLLEVAAGNAEVLKRPEPEVIFKDFGASSLDFELRTWVDVAEGAPSFVKIQSDLRFAIARVFAENEIEIPFPQRDVHLDTAGPLEVVVATREGK